MKLKTTITFTKKNQRRKIKILRTKWEKKIIYDKLGLNDEIENKYFFYKKTKKKREELKLKY